MLNEKRVEFKSRVRSWFELNCLDFLDMTGGHTIENEIGIKRPNNSRIDRPQKPGGSSEKYRVIVNLGHFRFFILITDRLKLEFTKRGFPN